MAASNTKVAVVAFLLFAMLVASSLPAATAEVDCVYECTSRCGGMNQATCESTCRDACTSALKAKQALDKQALEKKVTF